MIPEIKDIGKYIFEKDYGPGTPLEEVLVEDIRGYDHVLLIIFDQVDRGIYKYSGVIPEEYDPSRKTKYLYKSGSPRGSDATPTSKITEIKKTLLTKILPCLKECSKSENPDHAHLAGQLAAELESGLNDITEQIEALLKGKIKAALVSIAIRSNNRYLYAGDFDIFRKRIVDFSLQKYRFKHGTVSEAGDKLCSVCGERKDRIFGFAAPYSFYTVDKLGYVSGGFDRKNTWKNHGICSDCALYLDIGSNYVDNKLRPYPFYKRSYFIIPRVFNNSKSILGYILKLYERAQLDLQALDKNKGKTAVVRELEKEINIEENILEYLGGLDEEPANNVVYNIVFYHTDNSAFKIDLMIEDVLPSRLKKIYSTLKTVNRADFFRSFMLRSDSGPKGAKEESFTISHGFLAWMFNKDYNPYFLETMDRIIRGNSISLDFIISHCMRVIREAFNSDIKNRGEWGYSSSKTLINAYGFLFYLKLLYKGDGDMTDSINLKNSYEVADYDGNTTRMYQAFFEEHLDFYDSPLKRAVFLTGILAKLVLRIQYKDFNGRQSLWKKFKGLRLKKEDVYSIFTECNKLLKNYNKDGYYRELRKLLASYISNTIESSGKLSMDEISLIFTLGLNMQQCFNLIKQGKDDGNE